MLQKKNQKKKYERALKKKRGYGNNDLSEKGDDFWNYG